jgi:hypothetical protein
VSPSFNSPIPCNQNQIDFICVEIDAACMHGRHHPSRSSAALLVLLGLLHAAACSWRITITHMLADRRSVVWRIDP